MDSIVYPGCKSQPRTCVPSSVMKHLDLVSDLALGRRIWHRSIRMGRKKSPDFMGESHKIRSNICRYPEAETRSHGTFAVFDPRPDQNMAFSRSSS